MNEGHYEIRKRGMYDCRRKRGCSVARFNPHCEYVKMAERGAPPPRNVVYVRVKMAMRPLFLNLAAIRWPPEQAYRIEKPQETEQD